MKLMETIDDILTQGIFKSLVNYLNLEWFTVEMAESLDLDFYSSRADKKISPIYNLMYEKNYTYEEMMSTLSKIITLKYKKNWDSIYKTLNMEYNPIENYNSEEIENVGTDATVVNSSKGQEYAFNSAEGRNANAVDSSTTSSSDFDKNKRVLTRKGNIGVTTSQQLIESELKLREYLFWDKMLNDVDDILCSYLWG